MSPTETNLSCASIGSNVNNTINKYAKKYMMGVCRAFIQNSTAQVVAYHPPSTFIHLLLW